MVFLDGLPDGVDLGDLGAATVVRRLPSDRRRHADLPHRPRGDWPAGCRPLFERTTTDGMVWVCWPKKAAQRSPANPDGLVSDLDENLVRGARASSSGSSTSRSRRSTRSGRG